MSAFNYTANLGFKLIGDEVGAYMGGNIAETLVGSELLTDGNMTSMSGWTLLVGTGGGSIVSSGGQMLFTQGGTSKPMHAFQGFSVVEGQSYLFDVSNITGTVANLKISVGTLAPAADTVYVGTHGTITFLANRNEFITFTAIVTGTIYITISDEQSSSSTSTWDDATTRLGIVGNGLGLADGLMVFGSLIKLPVNTNSGTMLFTNFSVSNYAHQPYLEAFDPGTGAFQVKFWLIMAANTVEETIYCRDSVASGNRIVVAVNASGFLEFTCDDGTTTRVATSAVPVDDGIKRHVSASYDGAGTLNIHVNRSLDGTATGTALLTLTNTGAITRWGVNAQTLLPLTNGNLLLASAGKSNRTLSQINSMIDSEEVLFLPDHIYTQVGVNYNIDIILSRRTAGNESIRNTSKTYDGTIKSLKLRNDKIVNINTLPVLDSTFDTIRRFLDSVDNTQLFTIDLKGTVDTPYDVQSYTIESDSYVESVVGADHIGTSFKVIQQ